MSAPFPQFILAYHGCDRELGEAVLLGRTTLKASMNKYDWLGSGIYFWENSFERAYQWACDARDNPEICHGRIKTPFVLGAFIQAGRCLNLLDLEWCRVLKEFYSICADTDKLHGIPLPQNQGKLRRLDCYLINRAIHWLHAEADYEVDTVRCAFIEGEAIYPTAGFHEQTHIQINVRNPACIQGVFLPAELMKRH